jgi:hypothetical protein
MPQKEINAYRKRKSFSIGQDDSYEQCGPWASCLKGGSAVVFVYVTRISFSRFTGIVHSLSLVILSILNYFNKVGQAIFSFSLPSVRNNQNRPFHFKTYIYIYIYILHTKLVRVVEFCLQGVVV